MRHVEGRVCMYEGGSREPGATNDEDWVLAGSGEWRASRKCSGQPQDSATANAKVERREAERGGRTAGF